MHYLVTSLISQLDTPFYSDAPDGDLDSSFTASEFFFYLAFTALCLWQGIQTTNFETVLLFNVSTFKTAMQVICFACLAVKLILDPPVFKNGVLGAFIGLVLIVSYATCGSSVLFVSFAFVFAGRNINFRRLAMIAMAVYGFLFIVTVSSALSGQIAIVETVRSGGQVRSSLGFTHPNRFSTTIFQILASWLILRFPKFNLLDLVICISAVCPILLIADSRTTALAIFAMVVVIQLAQLFERCAKPELFIALCGLLILGLIAASIYFMFCYDSGNALHKLLNSALSGRLSFAHDYSSTFPLCLFGRSFSSDTLYTFVTGGQSLGIVVDNTYARIPIMYGIVPAALLFGGFCGLLINELKSRSIRCEFLFLVVFLIVGFTESFVLNLSMDIALMSFTALFVPVSASDGVSQEGLGRGWPLE